MNVNKLGITAGSRHNEAARIRAERQQSKKLTNKEKLTFFEMMKRRASPNEIKMKLGIQSGQVADIMRQYGVVTTADLNRAIGVINKEIEEGRRNEIGVSEQLNVPSQPELERRKKEQSISDGLKTVNTTMPGAQKAITSLRDKRIAKINAAAELQPEIYKSFKIEDNKQEEFIKRLSMGKRLLARMYNVPQVIILREALRIDPDINLDLIPN